MSLRKPVFFIFLVMCFFMGEAQTVIPLYDGAKPNSKPCNVVETIPAPGRVGAVVNPVLYAYYPEKRDSFGTAVIICPGGGYARLAIDHEGHQVAKAYNKLGIAAFVLKYRTPMDTACILDRETVSLIDLEQAIKIVRDHAAEYKINPKCVGVTGFSAGGHLASTLGTHYKNCLVPNKENTSLRPDFLVLGYPVISFTDSLAHKGSRGSLIGNNPSMEKIILYSNELQVTPETPASFLFHAVDDKAVKMENSLEFFLALKKNNVPTEVHFFEKGGHGFGLGNNWMGLVFNWLKNNHFAKGDAEQ